MDVHVLVDEGRIAAVVSVVRPPPARARRALAPSPRSTRAPRSRNVSSIIRTIATGSKSIRPEGIGAAERLEDGELRHVDPARHRQRHRPREARVDLEQGGLAARGHLDLDVRDPSQADARGDLAAELLEGLVALGQPGDRDPRIDAEALAGDHGDDLAVAPRQDVERVLGPGEVLLDEHRAVAGKALELVEVGDQLDPA